MKIVDFPRQTDLIVVLYYILQINSRTDKVRNYMLFSYSQVNFFKETRLKYVNLVLQKAFYRAVTLLRVISVE